MAFSPREECLAACTVSNILAEGGPRHVGSDRFSMTIDMTEALASRPEISIDYSSAPIFEATDSGRVHLIFYTNVQSSMMGQFDISPEKSNTLKLSNFAFTSQYNTTPGSSLNVSAPFGVAPVYNSLPVVDTSGDTLTTASYTSPSPGYTCLATSPSPNQVAYSPPTNYQEAPLRHTALPQQPALPHPPSQGFSVSPVVSATSPLTISKPSARMRLS